MAKTTETKPSDVDTLLNIATDKSKGALGEGASNRSVATNLTMDASVTDDTGATTKVTTTAGVNLGVKTETTPAPASK